MEFAVALTARNYIKLSKLTRFGVGFRFKIGAGNKTSLSVSMNDTDTCRFIFLVDGRALGLRPLIDRETT